MKFKDFLIEYDNWEGDENHPFYDKPENSHDEDQFDGVGTGTLLSGQVVFDFQLEIANDVPDFDQVMIKMFESDHFSKLLSTELGSTFGTVKKAVQRATKNKLGGDKWTDYYKARVRQIKMDVK